MRQPAVATQGSEERFLERVLGVGSPEPAHEKPEDFGSVLFVQALERRNTHDYREKYEAVTRRTFRGGASRLPICMSMEM